MLQVGRFALTPSLVSQPVSSGAMKPPALANRFATPYTVPVRNSILKPCESMLYAVKH